MTSVIVESLYMFAGSQCPHVRDVRLRVRVWFQPSRFQDGQPAPTLPGPRKTDSINQ
jgi:hypothetical protein